MVWKIIQLRFYKKTEILIILVHLEIFKIRDENKKISKFNFVSRFKFYSFLRQKNDLCSLQSLPMKKSVYVFLISTVKQPVMN